MLFPLSVSQHLHEIECNDSVLIFNTVLNNPIIISHEDMLWIHQHPYITFDFYSTLEPDYQESIGVLVGSFVYLENGINEYDLCKSINDSYLKQFICGKTFQYLDLRISEVCNFGCPHCIASSADHGKMMTVEEGRRFIDQYVAFKKEAEPSFKDLNIHFGNREPLLNFCVIQELIDYIRTSIKSIMLIFQSIQISLC